MYDSDKKGCNFCGHDIHQDCNCGNDWKTCHEEERYFEKVFECREKKIIECREKPKGKDRC